MPGTSLEHEGFPHLLSLQQGNSGRDHYRPQEGNSRMVNYFLHNETVQLISRVKLISHVRVWNVVTETLYGESSTATIRGIRTERVTRDNNRNFLSRSILILQVRGHQATDDVPRSGTRSGRWPGPARLHELGNRIIGRSGAGTRML